MTLVGTRTPGRTSPATGRAVREEAWISLCLPLAPWVESRSRLVDGDLSYQRVEWVGRPNDACRLGPFVELSPCLGVRQLVRVVSSNESPIAAGTTQFAPLLPRPPAPSLPEGRRFSRIFCEWEIAEFALARGADSADAELPSGAECHVSCLVPTPLLLSEVVGRVSRGSPAGVIEGWYGSPFRAGEALVFAHHPSEMFHEWHIRSVGSALRWAMVRVWAGDLATLPTAPLRPASTPGR